MWKFYFVNRSVHNLSIAWTRIFVNRTSVNRRIPAPCWGFRTIVEVTLCVCVCALCFRQNWWQPLDKWGSQRCQLPASHARSNDVDLAWLTIHQPSPPPAVHTEPWLDCWLGCEKFCCSDITCCSQSVALTPNPIHTTRRGYYKEMWTLAMGLCHVLNAFSIWQHSIYSVQGNIYSFKWIKFFSWLGVKIGLGCTVTLNPLPRQLLMSPTADCDWCQRYFWQLSWWWAIQVASTVLSPTGLRYTVNLQVWCRV